VFGGLGVGWNGAQLARGITAFQVALITFLCGEVGLMRYKLYGVLMRAPQRPRSEGGAPATTERRKRHVRSRPQAAVEIRYVRTW